MYDTISYNIHSSRSHLTIHYSYLGKIDVQTKRLCDYPYKSTQWRDGYCTLPH